MNVLVVGRGKVGSSLAKALRRVPTVGVRLTGRGVKRADVRWATCVVLAVPDGAIDIAAQEIAPFVPRRGVVLHCAGARGTEVLAACADVGASIGVMHPLVSFASAKEPPPLGGATFTITGDVRAVRVAKNIAKACGARGVSVEVDPQTYHAAAALVANTTAALAHVGTQLLHRCGFAPRQARRAVAGLLRSVAFNVERVGVPEALTGPIRRGDVETVARHRTALRRVSTHMLANYDALVPLVASVAREAGLSARRARAIRKLIGRG